MADETLGMPYRRHPANGVLYVEGQPTIIFDTVCTKNRVPWLANDEVHQMLREVWRDASAWLVGRYIIMPDHIHMFVAGTSRNVDFRNWVKYWKSQFTRRHRIQDHRWQTDSWDTRMRTAEQYEEKWDYVRRNAVRHQLVEYPEDWQYQGTITELIWD